MHSAHRYLQNFSEALKALFNEGEIFNLCVDIDDLLSDFETADEYEEEENKIREAILYRRYVEDTTEDWYMALIYDIGEIMSLLRREETLSKRKEGFSIYRRLLRGLRNDSGDESGYESGGCRLGW